MGQQLNSPGRSLILIGVFGALSGIIVASIAILVHVHFSSPIMSLWEQSKELTPWSVLLMTAIVDGLLALATVGLAYLGSGRGTISWSLDRKSTRLNSSHSRASRMPSSA